MTTSSFFTESPTPYNAAANGEIVVVIGGAGSAIQPGVAVDVPILFNCTVNSVTLIADQVGSIVVDIWKNQLTQFPPLVGNSICAATLPTLASKQTYQDVNLTNWNLFINPNDVLRVNVNSATTVTRVTLILQITKT